MGNYGFFVFDYKIKNKQKHTRIIKKLFGSSLEMYAYIFAEDKGITEISKFYHAEKFFEEICSCIEGTFDYYSMNNPQEPTRFLIFDSKIKKQKGVIIYK
jgi:hypothetical protein